MLDLEKRTSEQIKKAERLIKNKKELAEFLDTFYKQKCSLRYKDFKALYLISEEHPEILYPYWGVFVKFLQSDNNTLKFYAIHIISNLIKIDNRGDFEEIFDDYYGILQGDLVPACHVAYTAAKIASAKPKLRPKIIAKLLETDKSKQTHKDILMANAVKSLSKMFEECKEKEKIIVFVKSLEKSKSPKARKEAKDFLKKYG